MVGGDDLALARRRQRGRDAQRSILRGRPLEAWKIASTAAARRGAARCQPEAMCEVAGHSSRVSGATW